MNNPFLPFLEYEVATDHEVNCFTIEVVRFTKDFGPYKTGTKVDSLSFDFIGGTVIEYKLGSDDIYEETRRLNICCNIKHKMNDLLNIITEDYIRKCIVGSMAGLNIGSVNYSTVRFVPWLINLIKKLV